MMGLVDKVAQIGDPLAQILLWMLAQTFFAYAAERLIVIVKRVGNGG